MIKRGDIYYISKNTEPSSGSVQQTGRPGIIVSNRANNRFSDVVEVVLLTTQPKTDLPTHVTINSTKKQSTALAETPKPVSVNQLENYLGHVTEEEMKAIDKALIIALELNKTYDEEYSEKESLNAEEFKTLQKDLIEYKTQFNIYKSLYEDLIKQLVNEKSA